MASVVKMSKFSTDPNVDRRIQLEMVHTFEEGYSNPVQDWGLMYMATATRLDEFKHSLDHSNYDLAMMVLSLSVISFVFGALHCIAWNYDFPSSAECL